MLGNNNQTINEMGKYILFSLQKYLITIGTVLMRNNKISINNRGEFLPNNLFLFTKSN